MPTYIKPGFWNSKRKELVGELNLDRLIQENIANITTTSTTTTSSISTTTTTTTSNIGTKVYIALLNQSGTNAPVPTVIDNNLPGTLTYTRVSAGTYRISYSLGALSSTTCIIYFPKNSISQNVVFSSGSILLTTPSGPPADGYLVNNVLDIKIFV